MTRLALRSVQHEVRTRIGQVIGYGELLLEELGDRGLTDLVPDIEHIIEAGRGLLDVVQGQLGSSAGTPHFETAGGSTPKAGPGGPRDTPHDRILVVDDDPANRALLRRHLERVGYAVTEAQDGRTAARLVGTEPFDLVLLDLVMPGVDGRQALQLFRQEWSASDLPVIVATALTDRQEVVNALTSGANDYVTKPFDFDIVLARVRLQLALGKATREIEGLMHQLEIRNSFLRRTFGRYVSDDIAESLLETDDGLELAGESRKITVLMSDLRGFTPLAERVEPTLVVAVLNEYLTAMSKIIADHRGTVNDYLGDGILAFFGAIQARSDDSRRAVECALAMHRSMPSVNQRIATRGPIELKMGIGIATGEVVVGNVGSERRSKFTAIGSAVNLAARLEGFAEPGETLISPATYDEVSDCVGDGQVRWVQPKGFKNAVAVWVISLPSDPRGAT
jgi:adenylate cyclase